MQVKENFLALVCFGLSGKRQVSIFVIGSELLPPSTSSNVPLGRGSEKTFTECLGASNVPPLPPKSNAEVNEVANITLGRENCSISV